MTVRIIQGDALEVLKTLPEESVHCCVTSPPYWGLRDYGVAGQLGLEPTPDEYVARMVDVFREVRRVLRDDGTLWLNLGDSYAGARGGRQGKNSSFASRAAALNGVRERNEDRLSEGLKPKDLVGIPWRVAFALQADGWWLRSDIIWAKPNPMPESVTDRPTKSHEYVFLMAKSERYYFDQDAVREPHTYAAEVRVATPKNIDGLGLKPTREYGAPLSSGRNIRSVWNVATQPYSESHFATFPPKLIEPCIKAGCPREQWDVNFRSGAEWPAGPGVVLDPFGGAGTSGLVADRLGRNAILIELNPEYAEIGRKRIHGDAPLFTEVQTHDHKAGVQDALERFNKKETKCHSSK